ncbi:MULTISPECIES: hypothetical protein [Ensifer]|nr:MULTISPECIES: hypothetical protein [Ensifer]MBD9489707.1 hypothetical protein [Ensifer sp. ENS11]MDP9631275.1 hypothetical protein [Ensifer adhaerens]
MSIDDVHGRSAELVGRNIDDDVAALDPGVALPAGVAKEAEIAQFRPGR